MRPDYKVFTTLALSETVGVQLWGPGSLYKDDKVVVWKDGRVTKPGGELITQLDEHQTGACFWDEDE